MPLDRLHSLVRTGQYLTAYREVERLAMDPELDPAHRAQVLILGVRAAAALREVYAAAKMAEKAVEAAELGSNWEDIGNARLHSALIYRELGDTAEALRFFRLFFAHLDRYSGLQPKTGYAYYNMGLTHQQRRDYGPAMDAYSLAAEDFERVGNASGVLISLQNGAWVLLLQGRPADAEPYINKAKALSAELQIARYQVTQLVVEALHARLVLNHAGAIALCEEVFQERREGVGQHHMAECCWIMAELTLETDRLQEAEYFADRARDHALQAKEPHLMNLAADIRRRVQIKKAGAPL